MDVTTLFKACVKTVRTRNKSFNTVNISNTKDRIFKKPENDFNARSKALIKQVTRLKEFLNQNQKAYLNFTNAKDAVINMTDGERDAIENGAQEIIKSSSNIINDLRNETMKGQPKQYIEHRNIVIELIETYLKIVSKSYFDMKGLRMKRSLEQQKMSKLEHNFSDANLYKPQRISEIRRNSLELDTKPIITPVEPACVSEELNQMSAEEMQMFESENEQMYNDLNSLDEEVKQIGNKVVHISQLQQLFTEKVLEQEKDIERISTTVVGATENLRDANDQIRQAIQRNAGLRVYVLFFLLVMSFSLLFLDWYND